MDIEHVKTEFMKHFSKAGYAPTDSVSLVIPELSTTFVLSVGLLQLKAVLTPHAEHAHFPDFCMVQRCMRQFDIESSGFANHLSFFEMAGAISSGKRSQSEVIQSVCGFLTGTVGLDKDCLVFSTFSGGEFMGQQLPGDNLSRQSLVSLGMSSSRILARGPESNFFGNTDRDVAYGPSVEIYLDRGPQLNCPEGGECRLDCLCQRFVEVATCVFLKYLRANGGFREMPRPFCEAGVGVERLAFTSSGLPSIHQLKPLQDVAVFMMEHQLLAEGWSDEVGRQAGICSDYLRAVTFAVADGARPGGSGGRQYVTRTLIRRLLIRADWQRGAFIQALPALVDLVAELNRHILDLPKSTRSSVCDVIASEIRLFRSHLEAGKISPDRYRRESAG
jgi:alanyl-tRNA synthetase